MIRSKTKLGPELDKIQQLLIKNGYPADFLLSCINQKLANFAAEKNYDFPHFLQMLLSSHYLSLGANFIIGIYRHTNGPFGKCFKAARISHKKQERRTF